MITKRGKKKRVVLSRHRRGQQKLLSFMVEGCMLFDSWTTLLSASVHIHTHTHARGLFISRISPPFFSYARIQKLKNENKNPIFQEKSLAFIYTAQLLEFQNVMLGQFCCWFLPTYYTAGPSHELIWYDINRTSINRIIISQLHTHNFQINEQEEIEGNCRKMAVPPGSIPIQRGAKIELTKNKTRYSLRNWSFNMYIA